VGLGLAWGGLVGLGEAWWGLVGLVGEGGSGCSYRKS
jgi:hypothetical protein